MKCVENDEGEFLYSPQTDSFCAVDPLHTNMYYLTRAIFRVVHCAVGYSDLSGAVGL